ncbi:MAG: PLDc N-terminal domain-containing protein [Bacteroidales bacterium]|nr:PLDc N-terminal domain-containing protein [Bacteroidales bacterium]MCF8391112.1 PLDc N-terminal domain-containing protein [Bacteroidales bacterium]
MNLLFIFGLFGILFFILFILLLPLVAIVNLLMSEFKNSNDKIVWLILIIVIPILGSILYFLMSDRQKV